eukprot:gnl/TRDRNA2_/TRDRNA2_139733_c2_seq4.p1 gnl/TRDRNA2_/TRDRNA2_139733_c2~~gnl/TRDRNA2_/TRDRNA2_139733_c2_seq4.p1  ORF type:complete len:389 (-),score=58.67 gnl/TRDRNA2_/TRDRNA2_139733_c2_seq4:110-1276(-)
MIGSNFRSPSSDMIMEEVLNRDEPESEDFWTAFATGDNRNRQECWPTYSKPCDPQIVPKPVDLGSFGAWPLRGVDNHSGSMANPNMSLLSDLATLMEQVQNRESSKLQKGLHMEGVKAVEARRRPPPCAEFAPNGVATVQAPVVQGRIVRVSPVEVSKEAVYTVMVRNIPNRYTQQMLLEELSDRGFFGMFDFFYLPIDPETNANRGYAFINFPNPADVHGFKAEFEGHQLSRFESSKFISVVPATLQGFEANHAHYASARVSRGDPCARPLFLRSPASSPAKGQIPAARRGGRRRGAASVIDMEARRKVLSQDKLEAEVLMAAAAQAALQAMPNTEKQGAGGVAARGPPKPQKAPVCAQFCPYCGSKSEPHHNFCQFCGKSLALTSD